MSKNKHLDNIVDKLIKDEAFLVNALLSIYNQMDYSEKVSGQAVEDDGVGFDKYRSPILISISKQVLKSRIITEKQVEVVRRHIVRYRKQVDKLIKDAKFVNYGIKVKRKRKIAVFYRNEGYCYIAIPYDEILVGLIKKSGEWFYETDTCKWRIPLDVRRVLYLIDKFSNLGYEIDTQFFKKNTIIIKEKIEYETGVAEFKFIIPYDRVVIDYLKSVFRPVEIDYDRDNNLWMVLGDSKDVDRFIELCYSYFVTEISYVTK